jgi:Outer membrane protein beta-barrel family
MKFTIILLTFLSLCTLTLSAQNTWSIKGAIVDTASNSKLVNTSICVLNAKDSTLVSFTRAGANGAFSIDNLKKGKFILLVTYPAYADYVEKFTLDSTKTTHDFAKLNMILKAKLLADVIVKSTRAAIKIKGDTTEFDAKVFVVQPNATVEDLLKQLPGIQVDKDGKITAQGQTVPKVLVDGEEFFGDDPTLVTKNLRADMVDKVQLFDKKSDQATFTGIDDGQKTKTINIQLKADKKNGYFGKAEAGGGTGDIYQSLILFNRFKAKSKFSAYGILGNNGKVGLGWDDNQKYGGSAQGLEFGDDGSVSFFFNGDGDGLDTFGGQYNGQGLPLARTGGLHYDSKWNKDKETLNTNYKIGSITVDGIENTLSQNSTPDGSINTTSNRNYHNYLFRQKLDGTYTVKLDSTSNLKVVIDGTEKNGQTKSNYDYLSQRQDATKLNTNLRDVINNTDGKIFDASAFYTKKFKKKGRTFSLNLSETLNQSNAHGNLKSTANFFDPTGALTQTIVTDQLKTSTTNSSTLTSNATYTEPLMKDFALVFNYAIAYNHGISDQRSFNQSVHGVYNVQVDSLSNNYKLNELSNQVGAVFNYKTKKATVNFGTKVSNVNFNQTNEFTGGQLKRDFVNWGPQASLQYRFSQQQSVYFNYRGNATQPSITQIQPVINNTDNLNTVTGNPDLKPSFTHNFDFFYYSYKVITGQSVNFSGNYTLTNNPIVSNLFTDTSKGKTFSQYVNLGNKKPFNFRLNGSFDKKVEKLDLNVGLRVSTNGSTSYTISNGTLNRIIYNNYSGQITLSKYKEKKYEMYASLGPNYTISNSSLLTNINNNGRGFRADGAFSYYLPAKFQIGSDVDYEYTAKTQTFSQDLKKTLLNANITKTFFKNDDLKLTLWANDLLNQNVGFNRSVSGNFIQQDSYTTIKRYFMFTVTWNFNSMNATTAKK